MRPATTLRHLTPHRPGRWQPGGAPATAADPPLQQNPGSGQPRPRTPPAGPGDGAWPPGSPQGERDGNRGGVVNDLADQGETGRRRVYGSYKLPRLAALKDRWDPEHVVHRNHHIRPHRR